MRAEQTTGPSADVFVSYAREELAFVRRLAGLLEDEGLRPWVDVEGVYAGEEYWPELCKAIDAAAAFVFVITGASVSSRFCRRELERAVAGGKRVVPVCREEVTVEQLPSHLAELQWVFFRDGDDTKAAAGGLLLAIRADWMWLRRGAELLRRAKEWQSRDHDSSRLIRGTELRDAEEWLAVKPPADAAVTPLHVSFVQMSRAASRRRAIRLAAAAFFALAIIAVVGSVALLRHVESLNNLSLDDLNRDNPDDALSRLQRAENICAMLPFAGERCHDVMLTLGRAYLDKSQYATALTIFTRVVDNTAPARLDDAAHQDLRAAAFQNRAYAHIMHAEAGAEDARLGEYVLAQADLDTAVRIYDQLAGGANAQPISLTRARIYIGRGDFQHALVELGRAAQLSDVPDVNLLLSATYRCLGEGLKSLDYLKRYMTSLPKLHRDPHWQRNQRYFERIAKRCSKPSH